MTTTDPSPDESTMDDDEFPVAILSVYPTDGTRIDTKDFMMARGVQFPSGTVILEWNRDAFHPGDRLVHPHRSIYGSIDDARQGVGGEIVVDEVDV